jgi:hypothetical protein
VLAAAIAVNVGSVWLRGRASGRMEAFYLVCAGTAALLAGRFIPGWADAAPVGIVLTMVGTLLSTLRVTGRASALWPRVQPWLFKMRRKTTSS